MSDGRELKRISLQFRNLVSRALRSDEEDARVNLRRLLALVRSTPLLWSAISSAPAPTFDVMERWTHAQNAGEKLPMPDDPMEELGVVHAVLEELAKPSEKDFWHLCYRYGNAHELKDCVEKVLHDIVGRYDSHLRGVIEMALLDTNDAAYDTRRVDIHVLGGTNQVNLAQSGSQISAAQHVSTDTATALRLARAIVAQAAQLPTAERSPDVPELVEVAEAAAEELQRPTPRKFSLGAVKERLETLAAGSNAIGTLASNAQALADTIGKLLRADS